jgi:hypothetical protein
MGAVIVTGGCAAKQTASAESEPEAPVISQAQPSKPLQAAPLAVQAAPTQSVNSSQPAPAVAEWTTPFPHVAVNRAARQVRVNGFVPIDAHNKKTPRVFLEVLVCSRNTKEHEALVVTDAKPSHVHAAMLMIGLEPGAPGSWRWAEGAAKPEAIAPNGPRIRVTVRPEGGQAVDIREWVVQRDGATRLPAHEHLVFAGSIFRTLGAPGEARAIYGADADGTIVGLTAFGTETIAWSGMYHHETAMEQPAWMADAARMPKFGTDVEVLIEPIAP